MVGDLLVKVNGARPPEMVEDLLRPSSVASDSTSGTPAFTTIGAVVVPPATQVNGATPVRVMERSAKFTPLETRTRVVAPPPGSVTRRVTVMIPLENWASTRNGSSATTLNTGAVPVYPAGIVWETNDENATPHPSPVKAAGARVGTGKATAVPAGGRSSVPTALPMLKVATRPIASVTVMVLPFAPILQTAPVTTTRIDPPFIPSVVPFAGTGTLCGAKGDPAITEKSGIDWRTV